MKKMIRRKELHDRVPLSDSIIYKMEQNEQFPRRFSLTSRCVVWDLAKYGIVSNEMSHAN